MKQVMETLGLTSNYQPFTLCIEDNTPLIPRQKEEIAERIPPYVLRTQNKFMECPTCHRIYWQGTHWQAMLRTLEGFSKDESP